MNKGLGKIMVAGIGTDVGKTVVSAILTTALDGDYWKPVQCGDEEHSDTNRIKTLVDISKHQVYPPIYSLKHALSPHHAAHLENIAIDPNAIIPPQTIRPLIIEGVGGIFVPLTTTIHTTDLFKTWNCRWIIVSRNYLGSINHTLLTLSALKQLNIYISGIIFNGESNPDSEAAILTMTKVPLMGRLYPEQQINQKTIQTYARQWKHTLLKNLH